MLDFQCSKAIIIFLGPTVAEIEAKLRSKLDIEFLRIIDETGGGCVGGKFNAIIVTKAFEGCLCQALSLSLSLMKFVVCY
jgi:stress-induced morphogen